MSNETKEYAGIEALRKFLENCKAIFASITHTHTKEDITDLVIDSELSSTSTNPVENKVIAESLRVITDTLEEVETSVDNKADALHDHNEIYYTKTDMNTMFETIAYIDENDDETVTLSVDLDELSSLVGGEI